jgi:hypothetical protein
MDDTQPNEATGQAYINVQNKFSNCTDTLIVPSIYIATKVDHDQITNSNKSQHQWPK